MTSPKSGALRIVTSSGSRFMISALRNGPMRLIEMNSVSTAMVTVTLTTSSANQPVPVCGGCQFQEDDEDRRGRHQRIPGEQPGIGAAKGPARDQQHCRAQARGAEGESKAGNRNRTRVRADNQRKAQKRNQGRGGAPPA